MEEFIKNHFFDLLNLVILPLFYWVWEADRKLLILQNKIKMYEDTNLNHSDLFKQLFEKLNEIKDEIHNSFVSQKSCDFRHK